MTSLNLGIVEAFKRGYRISNSGEILNPKGTVLKGSFTGGGYRYFSIRKVGKKIERGFLRVSVHRLLAFQKFENKLFEPNIVVRHLNSNKLDNSFDNIEIGSVSDNMLDQPKEVRIKRAKVAAATLKSLTDVQVLALREDRKNGAKYSELMQKYSISKSTVSYIVNKKTYKDVY